MLGTPVVRCYGACVNRKGWTMAILDLTSAPDTSLDLLESRHRRREGALKQLIELGFARGFVREPTLALQALSRRERVASTAHGKGVAVPQIRSIAVVRPWFALCRSAKGIEWPGADGPVRLVLCVLSPAGVSLERHMARVAAALDEVRLLKQRQWLLDVAPGVELRTWLEGLRS